MSLASIANSNRYDLPDYPAITKLKSRRQWVAWKYEDRGGPKPTKPPINPHTGDYAKSNDPQTWGSYEEAPARASNDGLAGIGFMLAEKDNLTGYDLDHCRNPKTGKIKPWAAEVVRLAETYAEISPSGTGVRMIAEGKVPSAIKCDPAGVEVYGLDRYLTMTGRKLDGAPDTIRPAVKTRLMCQERAELHAALTKAAPNIIAALKGRRKGEAASIWRQLDQEAPARLAARIQGHAEAPVGGSKRGVLWQALFGRQDGEFWRRVNDAALQNLSAWVPALFPAAKASAGGTAGAGYSVASADLNRPSDCRARPAGTTR
jgi:hypothetical protein